MIRLSGAIMAHEKRRLWAEQLSVETGLPIVWDRISSVWDTASRAWRAHDPEATHHVVIQDDAVLCRDFLPTVERFLQAIPYGTPAVLSVIDYRLHSQERHYTQAVAAGSRIWRSFASVHAVGMVLPVADIEEALQYGDTFEKMLHDDWRMKAYYQRRGIKFAFPIPSLLQHRHADENPTLLAGHDDKYGDRTSSNFIGADVSGLTIDWTQPNEDDQMTVRIAYINRKTGSKVAVAANSKAAVHFDKRPLWRRLDSDVTSDVPAPAQAPAPTFDPPPLSGAGSSRAAWHAYADHIGIEGAADMTRAQLIEACNGN